jgi:ParB family chromosome partitioning protein
MANNNSTSILKKAAQALKGRTTTKGRPAFVLTDRATPKLLRLSNIEFDPEQPRKNIGDISDLVTSITEHGLLTPLLVQPVGTNQYRIVAGERRYRACKQVGLDVVQCIVRTPTEQQTIELQLIENLHRKDLDAFEEAFGYARLKSEHNYSDATIAQKMAKSRTHVTQTLSLTKVPDDIREECQHADIPLSRDTLYLIAKQPTREKMLAVFQDVQNGVPREERRAKARKGEARQATAPKKPKWAYSSAEQKVTVVVQSHNSTLTKERRIEALREALKEVQAQ